MSSFVTLSYKRTTTDAPTIILLQRSYLVEAHTVDGAGHIDHSRVYTGYLVLLESTERIQLADGHRGRQGRWDDYSDDVQCLQNNVSWLQTPTAL